MKEIRNQLISITILLFLILLSINAKAAAPPPACYATPTASLSEHNNCYATCRQFESALLVGCYLADRDKTKSHKEHEDYCKKLAKELMGKDSGCK